MPDRRSASSTSLTASTLWHDLREALEREPRGDAVTPVKPGDADGRPPALDIVDAGGGTGGFAVPLAELGHRVVVVDPSPDSLASLARRAGEARVSDRVDARQGDLSSLLDVVPAGSADVLVCHSVLEYADDADEALAGAGAVLRPGGLVSIVVANRLAVVLARALAGRFEEAAVVLADPEGRAGQHDRALRRFDADSLAAVAERAGMQVQAVHGVRVFSDLVPGGVLDDPGRRVALQQLESAASRDPALRVVASSLHLLARRP